MYGDFLSHENYIYQYFSLKVHQRQGEALQQAHRCINLHCPGGERVPKTSGKPQGGLVQAQGVHHPPKGQMVRHLV